MIGTQVSASLVWRLAISDCLVGGLRNRALDYTSSGMVGGFLAKSGVDTDQSTFWYGPEYLNPFEYSEHPKS